MNQQLPPVRVQLDEGEETAPSPNSLFFKHIQPAFDSCNYGRALSSDEYYEIRRACYAAIDEALQYAAVNAAPPPLRYAWGVESKAGYVVFLTRDAGGSPMPITPNAICRTHFAEQARQVANALNATLKQP
jgi:hypothetical protein